MHPLYSILPHLPPTLFLLMDAESACHLADFFERQGYGWKNAAGILTLLVHDEGNVTSDLVATTKIATAILNNCWVMAEGFDNPRATFEEWYGPAFQRERTMREIPGSGRLATSPPLWASAFGIWLMNGQDVDAGFNLVHHLVLVKHLTIPQTELLIHCLRNGLTSEQQKVACELLGKHAFTNAELADPSRIVTHLTQPDWLEVLEVWRRRNGHKPLWGDAVNAKNRNTRAPKRRHERQPRTIVRLPPPTNHAPVVAAPPIVKAGDPLIERLKRLLPRNIRKEAAKVAEAVRALAADPCVTMDVSGLTVAVRRRRKSAGGSCEEHIIKKCLPDLERHGLIHIEPNGRVRYRADANI